jgi:3-deoxy-manno-octulosonate cytidylyltransferase (CMP-KDO synthetase)
MEFGGNVVMTSTNCETGTDRLAEVVANYPHLKSDIVVNIQGDEPCVDPRTIDAVIEILHSDPLASMSTAAVLLETEEEAISPSIVKCTLDQRSNALYFSRNLIPSNKTGSYCSETVYYRHIGIYSYRSEFLTKYACLAKTPLQSTEDLEQLKALEHGYRIKVAIVKSSAVGVDLPEDIQKIEKILCKQNTSL